jgi:hypothetical protein
VYYDLVSTYLSGLTLINTTFILLCAFIVYVVVVTQRRKDFDFAEMLKSNGKPSSVRLAVLVSLATSTWVLMQVTLASSSGRPANQGKSGRNGARSIIPGSIYLAARRQPGQPYIPG